MHGEHPQNGHAKPYQPHHSDVNTKIIGQTGTHPRNFGVFRIAEELFGFHAGAGFGILFGFVRKISFFLFFNGFWGTDLCNHPFYIRIIDHFAFAECILKDLYHTDLDVVHDFIGFRGVQ